MCKSFFYLAAFYQITTFALSKHFLHKNTLTTCFFDKNLLSLQCKYDKLWITDAK